MTDETNQSAPAKPFCIHGLADSSICPDCARPDTAPGEMLALAIEELLDEYAVYLHRRDLDNSAAVRVKILAALRAQSGEPDNVDKARAWDAVATARAKTRAATIEECAKIAERLDPEGLKCTNGHDRCFGGYADEDCPYCELNSSIASAIRALAQGVKP